MHQLQKKPGKRRKVEGAVAFLNIPDCPFNSNESAEVQGALFKLKAATDRLAGKNLVTKLLCSKGRADFER
jgi:hypothetical protein